jgi:hypothetical protein
MLRPSPDETQGWINHILRIEIHEADLYELDARRRIGPRARRSASRRNWIVWDGDRVRFARQPSNAAEEDAARRAALVCPTGSIERSGGGSPLKPYFPEKIVHGVF